MNRLLKTPFFLICAGVFLISTNAFSAIVVTKPGATTLINSASSKTWYDTSFTSSSFTPSKLVSSLNKMTWHTAYLNYHNSEYPLSSAENVTADSSGNLYICWVNDNDELNLSTNKSGLGEWEVEKIADDVHSCAHISLDSSDNIHMISYSSDTGYYRHITGVANSWTITNLGAVADVSDPSFAIDSSGYVHMSYFDETNLNLKYATNTSGTLVSETVASISTIMCASAGAKIAIGTSNNPHIAYLDGMSSIKYAAKAGGTWTNESVDATDDCSDLSIAVNSQGYARIAYTGFDSSGNPTPKYTTNKSGSWKKRSLEMVLAPWEYAEYDQFSDFSIALDSQENTHVSYSYTPIGGGGRDRAIKYATNENGAFKSYTVTDCNSALFTKVIVTSSTTSKVTTTKPILSSVTSKTMTPILSAVVDQKVAIIATDNSSSVYDTIYVSTEEITDTCSDFTLTLTDADCDGTDDTEEVDTDGDGITNDTDTDDDGDGTLDGDDALPSDATETTDTDGDGIGNNTDTDDDGDTILDADDAFPLDETETLNTDGDEFGNNADTDDDGDGIDDSTDTDDDGDGTPDESDPDHPDYGYQDELSDIDGEGSF